MHLIGNKRKLSGKDGPEQKQRDEKSEKTTNQAMWYTVIVISLAMMTKRLPFCFQYMSTGDDIIMNI